ncbi:interleukin-21 receptor isoform X2 [Electrophorus electricus]|uniref:interleukin-21 receptor isoform X2 n=1 Tax=Electrophorus electricus TaxID=8005 RepID=UPI0015D0C3CF|nr:interleukin-21 receptor isoform X2 [Electrophorus electricus]
MVPGLLVDEDMDLPPFPESTSGSNYNLECLNDYLFTITCLLNTSTEVLPHSTTSWLEFYDYVDMNQGHKCVLKAHTHGWVCVLDVSPWLEYTFSDTDTFQISLTSSYHGNNSSVVLEMEYMPVKHIRPVPPTNLTLLWEIDQAVFYWQSGYQENIFLIPYLQYKFSISSKDQVLDVQLVDTNVAVEVARFAPHTNYTARVCSMPNQMHYKGVWSQWGSAIHWTTGAIHKADSLDTSLDSRWFALISVLLVLLLFYIPYSWCKSQVLTPSPTSYFRDFKRPAVQPAVLPQQEESLKIDSIFEEFESSPQSSSTHYEKISIYANSGYACISAPPKSPSMLHCTEGAEVRAAESSSMMYTKDYCKLSHTD